MNRVTDLVAAAGGFSYDASSSPVAEDLLARSVTQCQKNSTDPSSKSSSKLRRPHEKRSCKVSENLNCVVCDDGNKVGKHHGAVTCLACESFFRRSIVKKICYVRKNYGCYGRCKLDRDSRKTQRRCSYCRFQKCLEMGLQMRSKSNCAARQRESGPERPFYSLQSVGTSELILERLSSTQESLSAVGVGVTFESTEVEVTPPDSEDDRVKTFTNSGSAEQQVDISERPRPASPVYSDISSASDCTSASTYTFFQDSSSGFEGDVVLQYYNQQLELEPENMVVNGLSLPSAPSTVASKEKDASDAAAAAVILHMLEEENRVIPEAEEWWEFDLILSKPNTFTESLVADFAEVIHEASSKILLSSINWAGSLPLFKALPLEVRVSALQSCWTDLFTLGFLQCHTQLPLNLLITQVALLSKCSEAIHNLPLIQKYFFKLNFLVEKIQALDLDSSHFAALKALALFSPDRYTSQCGTKTMCAMSDVQELALIQLTSRFLASSKEIQQCRLQNALLLLSQIRMVDSNLIHEIFLKNSTLLGPMKAENIIPEMFKIISDHRS